MQLRNLYNNIFGGKVSKYLFNILITPRTVGIFNKVYESSPSFLLDIYIRMFSPQKFDYTWNIKLPNKKFVKVKVSPKYFPSWEFSLSYKWHDRALRNAELILNNYFDLDSYYLDIGANHGLRSLYSLSIGRPVVLFEPNIFLKDFTESLYRENKFSNYKLENICLSNKIGRASFFLSENSYESSLIKDFAGSNAKEIETEVCTLDSYVESNLPEKKIKIIKIDVEGNEIEVIEGMKKVIEKNSPSLLIEIISAKNKTTLFNFFDALGYYSYALINFPFQKILRINNADEIEKSPHVIRATNFLFTKENIFE